jgi:hypothetical protein
LHNVSLGTADLLIVKTNSPLGMKPRYMRFLFTIVRFAFQLVSGRVGIPRRRLE